MVASHHKFLGLPTMVGRLKNQGSQFVCDKLQNKKLEGWKEKTLPRVGRGNLKNCSSDYSLLFDGIFLYCQYNYIESITTWFSWRGDVDSENI